MAWSHISVTKLRLETFKVGSCHLGFYLHLLYQSRAAVSIRNREEVRANHLDSVSEIGGFGFAEHGHVRLRAVENVLDFFSELVGHELEVIRIEHHFLWHRVVDGDNLMEVRVNILLSELSECCLVK